ncbi:Fpg/Nei family DNA glycosylase [Edaphobacter modestus]|uniref:DNA-(apurinic or apyrimidinic site) lyase n=1 Tax=Edaphobacter modestus TaxID=388466 RepID=A0A4Q7YNR2_9BACT|nr:DNA-formamidopyrimidine glycosylase family protein [Edaphobacter modestus]RZU38988.1 DNA-(apurinic or apyrimidinic site) lyase /endonuclease VIII [Edaphobacter modestus]
MPEGDTIYRSARALQRSIGGQVVTGFETGLAKLARIDDDTPLKGRTIEKIESRGKWLLIHFSGDLILLTHMLMSGSWHLYRARERWRRPRSSMRVVIRTPEWEAVAFNVPVAEFHTAHSLARHPHIQKIGPDILSTEFAVDNGIERLVRYAREAPAVEVAVALLNQQVISGLGNVYKNEVAFAAGINPFRPMKTLSLCEMQLIVETANRFMKANVMDGKGGGIVTYPGGRQTRHTMRSEGRLWVYRRQGHECRRCGATILMRKQGIQARSTYWCPKCQPAMQENS